MRLDGHALAMAATVCQLAACACEGPRQTTGPDAGGVDAARPDADVTDVARLDAASRDLSAPDTARLDTASQDLSVRDTALPDSTALDLSTPDTAQLDNATLDLGTPDTAQPDTVSLDLSTPDTARLDSTPRDLRAPDTTRLDLGEADTGETDAGESPQDHLLGYACAEGDQGRPLGGGEGYGAWLPSSGPAVLAVSDKEGLLAALGQAQAGEVVYVADDAVIDLSSEVDREIVVPAGVTLASGRGRAGSLGALLFTTRHDLNTHAARALFAVTGPGARITGLRLRGPDPEVGTTAASPMAEGVRTRLAALSRQQAFEIDNCELFGWPIAAVAVAGTDQARVHHNFFHHNRRAGYGYGVVVDGAFPVIGANVFDHNRHAIAATGYPGTSYEACHNLVLAHATSTSFDMHGGFDKGFYPDTAGSTLLIHHNTFLAGSVDGVGVRGVPDALARIEHNRFVHASSHLEPSAVWQRFWPAAPGCLSTGGCEVSDWAGHPGYQRMTDAELCRAACSPFIKVREPDGLTAITCADNTFDLPHQSAWFASFGAGTYWSFRAFSSVAVSDLLLGDLDGDGRADGLHVADDTWLLYPGLRPPALTLNRLPVAQADLALGDLDGDGQDDVFHADGAAWWVSRSGSGPWERLGTSQVRCADLHLADFDGDGRADVFSPGGGVWRVSWSGSTAWQTLNASTAALSALRFGDFDGDGRTDVFMADGSEWLVSWAGASAWQVLNHSSVSAVAIADLDGDGRSDVLRADGTSWQVSWSGTTAWQTLQELPETLAQLRFADVDGDGRADALSLR